MTTVRPNKRNATAMGKRLAEHVMMHAGETSQVHVVHILARDEVAREGAVDLAEESSREQMAQVLVKAGQTVLGWRKTSYAVTLKKTFTEQDEAAEGLNWTTERPGIQDMAVDAVLQVRVTGYGVPVLEVR